MASSNSDQIDIIHHLQDQTLIHLPKVMGIDFSITKNVVAMWISAGLCLFLFTFIARDRKFIPSKLRSFFEAILLYIRDEIARPSMGHHGDRYIPFLWTTFFFVLFCNYQGLVPFAATATANLSVTAALALISFILVHYAGIRQKGIGRYIKDFVPPVPMALYPLMFFVELISHTTRTVALAVRLFANMLAGHIVVLAIMGFIFIFKNYYVAAGSVVATTLFMCLELLFKLIQAYVFTLLTAVFIGMAIAEEH